MELNFFSLNLGTVLRSSILLVHLQLLGSLTYMNSKSSFFVKVLSIRFPFLVFTFAHHTCTESENPSHMFLEKADVQKIMANPHE